MAFSPWKLLTKVEDEFLWKMLELTGKGIRNTVAPHVGKAATDAVAKMAEIRKNAEEHRGELIAEMLNSPPRESQVWKARLRRWGQKLPRNYGPHPRRNYTWNDENKMIERLAWFRKSILEDPDDLVSRGGPSLRERRELWRRTLNILAHLEDEDFDPYMEAITHDVAQQYALMVWDYTKRGVVALNTAADRLGDEINVHRRMRNGLVPGSRRSMMRRHPSSIYVLGFFLDPIGWIRRGYRR
jgi:hypothetical protein